MPESGWLFDIRSNNGGPIPNATALGSLWMTRSVSSIVNTVFYLHPVSQAHWRENERYSNSEWFDAQSEPEGSPVQNGSRLQRAPKLFARSETGSYFRDGQAASLDDVIDFYDRGGDPVPAQYLRDLHNH